MRNVLALFMIFCSLAFVLTSCEKEEDGPDSNTLSLSFSGLENLGSDFAYEGWIMVDDVPQSTGTFTVDDNGGMSKTNFNIDAETLDQASAFILTIEPSPDSDPAPSLTHLMAGNFSASSADLTIDHGAAIGTDLTTATGEYILATPTDGGMMSDENSGVWWLNPANGPGRGLELPELAAGWKYEGWALIDDVPVSTGKFISVANSDESDTYSSTTASGPSFPGEDFLMNAPTGLDFPVNLAGRKVVISVEPEPDNSPGPFLLKPLLGQVPDPAVDHTVYDMTNNAASTNPTGTATR